MNSPTKLEEANKNNITIEELIIGLMEEKYKLDPEAKVELHTKLKDKYLEETKRFIQEKDYVEASEKAWRATTQILKALATKEGKPLRSHEELHKFIAELVKKTGDDELRILWGSAQSLHINFYEAWLPPELVQGYIDDVKKLIEKIESMLK